MLVVVGRNSYCELMNENDAIFLVGDYLKGLNVQWDASNSTATMMINGDGVYTKTEVDQKIAEACGGGTKDYNQLTNQPIDNYVLQNNLDCNKKNLTNILLFESEVLSSGASGPTSGFSSNTGTYCSGLSCGGFHTGWEAFNGNSNYCNSRW